MTTFFILILIFISCCLFFYLSKPVRSNTLTRFKKKINTGFSFRKRQLNQFSNYLLNNPEENISINTWFSESELREKADIHRTRLHKFGKSKMNGEIIFLSEEGEVFKYGENGQKIII